MTKTNVTKPECYEVNCMMTEPLDDLDPRCPGPELTVGDGLSRMRELYFLENYIWGLSPKRIKL